METTRRATAAGIMTAVSFCCFNQTAMITAFYATHLQYNTAQVS
jgi:hypothetical protein